MSLPNGARIGPYQISDPLGAGGMGEVYRARDSKLNRDVALKVLSASFVDDPDRMARFEREAQVLASLNHPHIASIYGLEERALVMELVEGPTLEERLAAGPLPLDETLRIALQIAEALEYAHEKGVIHRDLKPANVKITPEGAVKVLDFGLAKVATEPSSAGGDPMNSPTMSMRATQMGLIIGTAGYMSPEQASGRPVDRRADIWSFGVVLWEMLSGEPLFSGETVSHTLADVLRAPIQIAKLPASTPAFLREIVRRALDRDQRNRLRDIGEVRIAIQKYLSDPAAAEAAAVSPAPSVVRSSRIPWAVAAAATLAAIGLGLVAYRHSAEEPTRVLKLSVLPPPKTSFQSTSVPAISPDGRHLAFVATGDEGKDQLWIRDLNSEASRPLGGTDDATEPFWSPDSRSVGFFAGGRLKKIDIAGGPALTLCVASGTSYGGSWSPRGVIIFTGASVGPILSVPAGGGSTTPVTSLDSGAGEISHRLPWFLPDGRHFLYSARNTDPEKASIHVGDLDSKNRVRVVAAHSNGVFAAPGYVLFVRDLTLMALPFDADRLQVTGDAAPVAEQVNRSVGIWAQHRFTASQNGVLALITGSSGVAQYTWFDHSGKAIGTLGGRSGIGTGRWSSISPDGTRVATDRTDGATPGGRSDIWIYDLARGTESRFTFERVINVRPVWSPDSLQIAYASASQGLISVFRRAVSGATPEEVVVEPLGDPKRVTFPDDWSPDGRFQLATLLEGAQTGRSTWVVPLSKEDGKPYPLLQGSASMVDGKFSRDGKWVAYSSNESSRYQVYVRSFPDPGGKWQISVNGGNRPAWSRDGKELYFIENNERVMAVDIRNSGGKFDPGVPKPLFQLSGHARGNLDVSKDGRFLIAVEASEQSADPLTVVINWPQALRK